MSLEIIQILIWFVLLKDNISGHDLFHPHDVGHLSQGFFCEILFQHLDAVYNSHLDILLELRLKTSREFG